MTIRLCPRCGSERPLDEPYCLGSFRGETCYWDLTLVVPSEPAAARPGGSPAPSAADGLPPMPGAGPAVAGPPGADTAPDRDRCAVCPNGHPIEPGDLICPTCGADLPEEGASNPYSGRPAPQWTPVSAQIPAGQTAEPPAAGSSAPPPAHIPAGWRFVATLARTDGLRERILVASADGDRQAVLTRWEGGHEPDPEVYRALAQIDPAHVPALLEVGRGDGYAYEVAEYLPGGHLGDLPIAPGDRGRLRAAVAEIAAALAALARAGLRHRDLRPEAVLVRGAEPLDLVVGSFGSACLSELDLDLAAPLGSSRYMAPEVVAGAVAAASDWWSLGILVLEKLTGGACFAGVNDQAFLIHALVEGVALPPDLDPDWELLLRGLLARNRTRRWQWPEVSAWLDGQAPAAPPREDRDAEPGGALLALGGREHRGARRWALAAAEAAHWDEAREQLVRGRLVAWLEESGAHPRQVAAVRGVLARGLDPDTALSVVLKALDPDLPLVERGVILSPGWLLEHPERGYALIAGEVPGLLADLGAEPWLVQLRRRADLVRERAAYRDIALVEDRLRVLLLSTSQARLAALWEEQRRLFPDTDHAGLASIVDRLHWADEDLIVLLAAEPGQFRPIDEVLGETAELARWAGLADFDLQAARALLRVHTRRALFALVRERIADFATCGNPSLDQWATRFRLEGRAPLARALLILAVPPELWVLPPRQAYLGELLSFFEQKAAVSIRRGPLARMTVTRTGQRIDLTELATARQPADGLLDRILERGPRLLELDPAAFAPPPPDAGGEGEGPDAATPPGGDAPAGAGPAVQAHLPTDATLGGAVAPVPARPAAPPDAPHDAAVRTRGDPAVVAARDAPRRPPQDSPLERRLRNLVRHATVYRRDTGIDGLYLGFPFLVLALPNANLKPRIAPVLLWPVRLEAEVGRAGRIRLGFDPEREEVRLNPALDGYLDAPTLERWRQAADAVLGRSARVGDVMDELGRLAAPRGRTLAPLPGPEVRVGAGPGELHCAAVLFHMAFMGQAVIEDLRQLRALRPAGTGLESLLRMGLEPAPPAPPEPPAARVPELERWLTVASDPSQEAAVLDARERPGIVVSGPPGTGKSQTIVNIVCDAVGRGRSVLVVCQKQAALEVVHKRLDKEGLGGRVLMVTDRNRDRLEIVRTVREQIAALDHAEGASDRRARRAQVAAHIEELESRIDRRHAALHAIDPPTGLGYRQLVGELLALESGPRPPIGALAVRRVLAELDREALAQAEEQAPPLVPLWLAAGFEDSPLAVLKPFDPDPTARAALARDLARFADAERARARAWAEHPTAYRVDDPESARAWLATHRAGLAALAPGERAELARLLPLFQAEGDAAPSAAGARVALARLAAQLARLDAERPDPVALRAVQTLSGAALQSAYALAKSATCPVGPLGRLNPLRAWRRRGLRRLLAGLGLPRDGAGMEELRVAARCERHLRALGQALAELDRALGEPPAEGAGSDPRTLGHGVAARIARLDRWAPTVKALAACPAGAGAAYAAAGAGTPEAMAALFAGIDAALARHGSRAASGRALDALRHWMEPRWMDAAADRVRRGDPDPDGLAGLEAALPRVEPFQRFRLRAAGLAPATLRVLTALREVADALALLPAAARADETRRLLRRETCLAAKARLEAASPELLAGRAELAAAVARLAELDTEMRALNRACLARDIDRSRLGERRRWEDLTRLRGPRVKRLREFVDLGAEIGLMALRPVWLMNPNLVSQVLPLKAALFDVAIFDEASQMPVEVALPSLYRGAVAVVSGDEKQLPPTAFFASRVESEEADTCEGDAPDPESAEDGADLDLEEERWNRREIASCPDLLALALAALPQRLLEIHYRSNFRELIAYSNAAFYGGRLHVPVQRPRERVRAHRPLEVIRVDGRYAHQTNPQEAERIVDLIADLWSAAPDAPPTLGVVTFNRKQADLIEERIEARAEADETFRVAYARECERREDGEDMGFFVKNLENVQGDERDIVLFSTTFGRDARGRFRRNFGVLGQRGGERRLNVAVTRARDKIILATSMPTREVSDYLDSARPPVRPRDYLQAYLAYAERVSDGDLDAAESLIERLVRGSGADSRPDGGRTRADPFRALVGDFIRERLGQVPVEAADGTAFGIDWAIRARDGDGFALGIECDAPDHRLLRRARAREIWRPAVLARSLPAVHRVSCVAWYAQPAAERERLARAVAAAVAGPRPVATIAVEEEVSL